MSLRVGVGGIWHETNTFAVEETTVEDFRRYQYFAGAELVHGLSGTATEPGGVLTAAAEEGATAVPLVFAAAVPSGPVTPETFEQLCGELITRAEAERLDGVVLCLHGAMVVQGVGSPEAELARRVRAVFGDAPLAVTLDFHANIDAALADVADVLVGYTTYPHVDMAERGAEACRLVLRMLRERRRPLTRLVKLPLLSSPHVQDTDDEPMRSIRNALVRTKSDPQVWTASALPGFAFADVDRLGFTVYVAADDDAEARAGALAQLVWNSRPAFNRPLADVDDAVASARRGPAPAVLVDVGDNVGGGSPGDGTALLSAILEQNATGGLIVLWDPVAIGELYASSAEQVTLSVGGRAPGGLGPPVVVSGSVRRFGTVQYRRTSSYATGQHVDVGRVAVLETSAADIVLTENRIVPFDDDHLRVLGIEPKRKQMIVAKGAIAWKAAFGAYAAQSIYCKTPGCCPGDLTQLAYGPAPRLLYPLNPDARWAFSHSQITQGGGAIATTQTPLPTRSDS